MTKRILVVEDQEDNRRILRDLLTSADYELIEAGNGEEALAAGIGKRNRAICARMLDVHSVLKTEYGNRGRMHPGDAGSMVQ